MSRVVGGGFARHGVCVAYTCHDTHKRTGIPTCEVVAKKSCGNVVGRTFSRVFLSEESLMGASLLRSAGRPSTSSLKAARASGKDEIGFGKAMVKLVTPNCLRSALEARKRHKTWYTISTVDLGAGRRYVQRRLKS